MKKITYLIVGLIAVLAIAGGYFFPKYSPTVKGISSIPGAYFNTETSAEQSLATGTSTLFSLLNTDSADRIIEDFSAHVYAPVSTTTQVIGVACATSTIATGISQGSSANWILNQNISAFGTTTGDGAYITASSTPGITANLASSALATTTRIWNGGATTYLVCELSSDNGTALQSVNLGLKGYLKFGYAPQ